MIDTVEAQWCSFMPALMRAMVSSSGPVLEIGIGHFSTPVLHEVCLAQNRMLISVEDNLEWHENFAAKYVCSNHMLYFADYDQILPTFAEMRSKFGVVFIDESPGGSRRRKSFELFMPVSQYVVVHDYHRENSEAIQPLLTPDIQWKVYSDYDPPTLLAWKA